ncbi:MAG: GH1 family beta-glucosidase [Xanthomonadales bacterium]|jgi:beta-glucosidase|nr:GH1 family beta-glucosidase [Xanthomonadales bacterium]
MDFQWGAATAAFQIEGDAEHRQKCIWDTFCERPGAIADGSNGLVACDHVARYREDLDLLDRLNVDAYRFSLSWGRILDERGRIDPRGLDFYQRLLDGLHARGIAPWVTLYHWDLPQALEDRGGWLARDTVYRFRDYVEAVVEPLGEAVAGWITINEPMVCGYLGYASGVHAPGHRNPANYGAVAHHLLLAHGLGMQVLAERAPETPRGVALNISCVHAASDDPGDRAAARRADLTFYRRFLDPLLKGSYDPALAALPGEEPPAIVPGDLELISQPLDFLGINYYTRSVYRAAEDAAFEEVSPQGPLTAMGWEVYPEGLTQLLRTLDQDYDLPPVYITENGAAFPDRLEQGEVNDAERLAYVQAHLLAIDRALRDGIDVRGLFYWSLLDNFEWAEGYEKRFGMVYVDYDSQERIIKQSGLAYAKLLAERQARSRPRAVTGAD